MTDQASQLNVVIREAERAGGWATYAVLMMGEVSSGDLLLDDAVMKLYRAMEDVHRIANTLALRHHVGLLNE